MTATLGPKPRPATPREARRLPVLDASFLIDLEQGVEQAFLVLDVLKTEDLVVPGHAALEFMSGRGEPIGVLHAIRDSYRLALARDETLVAAARLRASAKGKGRPKWGDLYIAAEAQVQATYVVTANPKDFEALGCAVWDYRRGSAPPS